MTPFEHQAYHNSMDSEFEEFVQIVTHTKCARAHSLIEFYFSEAATHSYTDTHIYITNEINVINIMLLNIMLLFVCVMSVCVVFFICILCRFRLFALKWLDSVSFAISCELILV